MYLCAIHHTIKLTLMKHIRLFFVALLVATCTSFTANGQSGTFTTIAGNGHNNLPNTSGPATASAVDSFMGIGDVMRITTDFAGNVYFGGYAEHVISRINTDGSISRIIGDGREMDGPDDSVFVNHVGWLTSMACDGAGNLYFTDYDNYASVKKISPTGVLSNFATGSLSRFVYVDSLNNVYYGDGATIKKVTPSGATVLIAGSVSGFGGDGGPATAALIGEPVDMAIDATGNIYILDSWNYRIRMINPSGIISTIAGNSIAATTGDGGPAYLASIDYCEKLTIDREGNLILSTIGATRMINPAGIISSPDIFSDKNALTTDKWGNIICNAQNDYIQKFIPTPTAASSSFSLRVSRSCAGAIVNISTTLNDTTFKSVNYYGDGSVDTISFHTGSFGAGAYTSTLHSYAVAGAYTIKNVIISSSGAIDSFTTTYVNQPCTELFVKSYVDNNSNCHFDSTVDISGYFPLNVEVDSNGISVDTISLTGGAYYTTYGSTGDIYTFRALSTPVGIIPTCPSSGIVADTLSMYGDNARTLWLGFNCSATAGFDIGVHSSHIAARHTQQFQIAVNNNYCTPTTVTVKANISTKYDFFSSIPAPTSISGHVVTWIIPNISTSTPTTNISLHLEKPGSPTDWLIPGDTVHTTISVSPIAGDLDTTNNVKFYVDTVRASFDPNYIAVTPQGNILAGTKLQYTIEFENDGNDTAQNIYVMDTLSDNIDPSSIEMVMATNPMNIVKFRSGGHTILKFDFPNIKLLDSTHHNQCTGMLIYNFNVKKGLPDHTNIFNHAGIFFDDNPVVMTNTIRNAVRIPSISVAQVTTACHGDTASFVATTPNVANTYYKWFVNSAAAGSGKPEFASAILNTADMVKCQLWDGTGDSLLSTSNNISATFLPLPNAGTITGTPVVCELATTTLSNTITGGAWTSSTSSAIVTTGSVAGLTAGTAIISYSVTNTCGTSVDTMMITVRPLPQAGTIIGIPAVCELATATLSNLTTGGVWASSNATATITGGIISGVSAGNAVISYSITNSCGTAVDTMLVTINPLPVAGTITGMPTVCELATTTLSNATIGGTWLSSSSSATIAGGVVTGANAGNAIISYSVTNSCGTAIDTMLITVHPLADAGTITGITPLCMAASIAVSATMSGGTWSSSAPGIATVNALGVVSGMAAGSATLFYTVTTFCGSDTTSTMVTVNPNPTVGIIGGPDSVCMGNTINLTNAVSGGTWSSLDTSIAIINTAGVLTAVNQGSVVIRYINSGDCGAALTAHTVTVLSSGDCNAAVTGAIADAKNLTLYPNPNNGTFTISGSLPSVNSDVTIEIMNLLGQVVYKNIAINNAGKLNELIQPDNKLADGTYLLRVNSGAASSVFHFVIKS